MTNVHNIIDFKKDEEDYYALLGCHENSTEQQIIAEYKARALLFHPDKNEGDKEAEAIFQRLKEAKETLCDPTKRTKYDRWRNSGLSIGFKQWLRMQRHINQSMHWVIHKPKDRMLPDGAGSASQRAASSGPSGAHRRASEGGANFCRGGLETATGDSSATSEVVKKFRNYEI